jgi:hypothetical protein
MSATSPRVRVRPAALNGRAISCSAEVGAPSTRIAMRSPLVSIVPDAAIAFCLRTTSRIWSTGTPAWPDGRG